MAGDHMDRFFGNDNDRPDEWDGEDNDFSDEDAEFPQSGLEIAISPFLGYEVELQGTFPIQLQIIRPATPNSARVLAGVYPDCIVVFDQEHYLVLPQTMVIVSVPRAEWESREPMESGDD